MADVLLEARDLHVSYGAIRALQGFSLTLREREIVAVIGANGADKFLPFNFHTYRYGTITFAVYKLLTTIYTTKATEKILMTLFWLMLIKPTSASTTDRKSVV